MPVSGHEILLTEKKGRILYVTLNRPERHNALSIESRELLAKAWEEFAADDDLWVAIVTGAGDRAFCSGADLKELADLGAGKVVQKAGPSLGVDLEIWKPVIAAINGFAVAGGWRLAQECDLRIAAEHAEFGIPEVRWNLSAGWCVTLPRQIGMGQALELVMMGERISARRAYEIGFVNKVVPADRLMETATQWAERICENGPESVRRHKEILYRGFNLSRKEAYAVAGHILAPLAGMEDTREGPRAFVEKRKPNWKGR